jgi:hypothetical protein
MPSTNPADISLCTVVLAELIYGALHSGPAHSQSNLAKIAALRQQFVRADQQSFGRKILSDAAGFFGSAVRRGQRVHPDHAQCRTGRTWSRPGAMWEWPAAGPGSSDAEGDAGIRF